MAGVKKGVKADYSARATVIWVIILLLFVGEFFFYTWCRVNCLSLRYDIKAEKDRARVLAAQQKDLKIELARLRSPVRIMKIAKEHGLVMPRADQIVQLPCENKTIKK